MATAVKKIKSLLRFVKRKELIPIITPVYSDQLLGGKVAFITGGSSGIGYSIAKAFCASGCKVIIAGTKEEKLQNCCNQLGKYVRYIVLNVLDIGKMKDTISKAAAMFPENRIDILVNSAGVLVKSDFFHIEEEEYDNIMNINTKGTFFMCKAMSEYMIANNIKGHILNISSSSALRPAWTPYEMSKWAVKGFTLGLADTLIPYGIVVNAIAPGPTITAMIGREEGDNLFSERSPAKRYIMPEEIASLATFMVSDMGNMIVGDTFYMTGGSGIISLHQ